jgi:hypothetical protein
MPTVDVVITADRNVKQKGAEKKLKHRSLCIQRERERERRAWNMICMIIPVIIRATGLVTKGLKKDSEAVAGDRSTDSRQKTAVLGTAHIIRNVLQCGTGRVSGGDRHWFKGRSAWEERAVTGGT